jgi:hypothetical protein
MGPTVTVILAVGTRFWFRSVTPVARRVSFALVPGVESTNSSEWTSPIRWRSLEL